MARYEVHLSGESFANADGSSRQKELQRLKVGDPVFLTREPLNPHDANAILVESERVVGIGYVERDAATTIAREIDGGAETSATIVSIGEGGSGLLGAIIEVRTGQNAEVGPRPKPAAFDPVKEKAGCSKVMAWGFIILLVLAAINKCASGDDSKPAEPIATGSATTKTETAAPAEPAAVKVTARELFDAYQANEVAAKAKYGGQRLEVSGTVAGVTLDFMDKPVVQLATPNQFMPVQASGIAGDVAGGLAKGQKVTVLCASVGEVIGAPMLDDCVVQP